MDNFKTIYKILKQLDKYKGREDFDTALISAQAMGIEFAEWEQLVIALQKSGYIEGIIFTKTLSDKFHHIAEPIYPNITLKGMEYLAENSFMAKARDALKMVGDIV